MPRPWIPHRIIFFFLMLPYGIGYGVVSILVPFLITQAGLPVAMAGSAVAIALLPNVLVVLWGPVLDLTLTLARWYWLGLLMFVGALLLIGVMPVRVETVRVVAAVAFFCEVGAALISVSVGGLIARTVAAAEQGRAGGWYQAGSMAGAGLGGGGGIWLATHLSMRMTAFLLAVTGVTCAAASIRFFRPLPHGIRNGSFKAEFGAFGHHLTELVRSPDSRLVVLLVVSPIGIGAATNLWSAIAPHWHASPNLVAFATGIVNGLAAFAGCLAGGWVADRLGRWTAYFGSGLLMALVAILMAEAAIIPTNLCLGILFYAASQGMANAAFSALVLHVVGRSAVATKYAMLVALGNIPVSYMTAFDGFTHDRWGAVGMLYAEAILGTLCIASGLLTLWLVRHRGARGARSFATS